MIGAIAGGAVGVGTVLFRYRCEYLHVRTSSRILFTVGVPVEVSGEPPWEEYFLSLGSAGEAIAKRLAAKWIEQTGLAAECVMLGVVAVTDKMSVRIPTPIPLTTIYSGDVATRCSSCGYPIAEGETLCGECACEDDGA